MIKHADRGLNKGPLLGTCEIRKFSATELLELGKTFNKQSKSLLASQLRLLWDMRADAVSLNVTEPEKLSNVAPHPSFKQRLHNLRQYEGTQSLVG